MKLKARFDAVIVKPYKVEEQQHGSIIVPDMGKEKTKRGTVIDVGPGRHVAGIGFVETTTQIGTEVILPSVGYSVVEHEGEDYYFLRENEILADLIKDENE
jgi:co-chaperonin GroES (HSP10)